MNNILIISPAWVGDAVLSHGLIQLLCFNYPAVRIDVLTPAWTEALFSRLSGVSHVVPLPVTHGEWRWRIRYALGKQLRQTAYDQAIVLPNSWKSALIPWLARIPKRTGWRGEYRYGLLNDLRLLDKKRYPRMIDRMIALGLPPDAPLPQKRFQPILHVSAASQQTIMNQYQLCVRERPIVALCPGAAFGSSKCWPVEYYATVANVLLHQGWQVWLLGSKDDRLFTDQVMILTHHRCENFAGRLRLEETIDLLSLVRGVVTNDSGLLHVACALDKPVIVLYGSTSPLFTPPLSTQATVLQTALPCQPCFKRDCPLKHHHCMKRMTPDRVLSIIQSGWTVCAS